MKKTLLLVLSLFVAIALFGIPFYTVSSSQPVLRIVENDFSGLMLPLENDWWWIDVPLEPGKYSYYFESAGDRFADSINPWVESVDGEFFSLLSLDDYSLTQDTVHHRLGERDFFNPVNEGEIYLSVSVPAGSSFVMRVLLGERKYDLEYLRDFGGRSFYRAGPIHFEKLEYYFEINTGQETFFLGLDGLNDKPERPFGFPSGRLPLSYFDTPTWSKGAIYYQIFPERFANGDRSNDPMGVQPWNIDPSMANLGGDGFFGGDLQGIIDRFDHLLDLGIDAIYLNPIFESPSSHKYDTEDYMKIDDNFGDDRVFEDMRLLADDYGIKLILDGVFNHTGYDFFAFKDLRERGEASEYVDWYFVKSFPIRRIRDRAMSYVGWNGYAYMPKVNALNEGWQSYVTELAEKYNARGIGGWRLDVATEVTPEFWSDFFRPLVKRLDEEMIIVAEFWGDARALLRGRTFDSAMNYPFKDAVVDYVFRAGNSARRFVAMTDFYLNAYPPQTLHSLWNILDSHDTERILTLAFNREELMKIAVAIQMTFIGSPVIYYGDEIGMKGGKDPDNRAPMIWDKERWNMDIYEYYLKLIELRKSNPALVTGSYSAILSEGPVLGYRRWLDEQEVYVFVNASREPVRVKLPLTGNYFENITETEIYLGSEEIELPPTTVWILTAE